MFFNAFISVASGLSNVQYLFTSNNLFIQDIKFERCFLGCVEFARAADMEIGKCNPKKLHSKLLLI